MITLDLNNPTPESMAEFDAQWYASRPPEIQALYAGTLGPGIQLDAMTRQNRAFSLAAQGLKVDLLTDGQPNSPAAVTLNRVRSFYAVFSYIGEPNPDWTTSPPTQSLPGLPNYNATGHTGVVSLTAPPPYVSPVQPPAPPPPVTTMVGAQIAGTNMFYATSLAVKTFSPTASGIKWPEGGVEYILSVGEPMPGAYDYFWTIAPAGS